MIGFTVVVVKNPQGIKFVCCWLNICMYSALPLCCVLLTQILCSVLTNMKLSSLANLNLIKSIPLYIALYLYVSLHILYAFD